MSLNIKDYGNVTVETRTILDRDPCYKNGNEDEEIQWYPDKYFLDGDIKGTFRHVNRVFATYKGIFIDGTCSFCASLPKLHSFQRRLERRFRSDNSVDPQICSHIPFENRSKEELVDSIKRIKSQEEELKKCNFFLKCHLERLQKRSKLWCDELKELSSKGSFSSVATKVERTFKNGSVKGKEGIMSILKTTCKTFQRRKKDVDIKALKETLSWN